MSKNSKSQEIIRQIMENRISLSDNNSNNNNNERSNNDSINQERRRLFSPQNNFNPNRSYQAGSSSRSRLQQRTTRTPSRSQSLQRSFPKDIVVDCICISGK